MDARSVDVEDIAMPELTDEMKTLIDEQMCWWVTTNSEGEYNIGPKRSTRVVDDNHVAYNEITGGTHWENVQENPNVTMGVADKENVDGYKFDGRAEIITDGPMYEGTVEAIEDNGLTHLLPVHAVVKVEIQDIYSLPGGAQKITD